MDFLLSLLCVFFLHKIYLIIHYVSIAFSINLFYYYKEIILVQVHGLGIGAAWVKAVLVVVAGIMARALVGTRGPTLVGSQGTAQRCPSDFPNDMLLGKLPRSHMRTTLIASKGYTSSDLRTSAKPHLISCHPMPAHITILRSKLLADEPLAEKLYPQYGTVFKK